MLNNRWMIENYGVEMICVVLPGKSPVYGKFIHYLIISKTNKHKHLVYDQLKPNSSNLFTTLV